MVNTEKQREYSRRHYEKNREKKLKYGQTYRKEHNEIEQVS